MPDYTALKSAIDADPAFVGVSDADVATALNAATTAVRVSRTITKVSIYKAVGFAAGLLLVGGLKQMAASADAATSLQGSELLDLIRVDGAGIDIGLDESRAVIDQLAAGGLMTADTATAIKAIGEAATTRAIQIVGWGIPVSEHDIAAARNL